MSFTNYWIREMIIEEKKLMLFLKKLKIQFNYTDQELKLIWEYDVYIYQDNIWIKIQGVDE